MKKKQQTNKKQPIKLTIYAYMQIEAYIFRNEIIIKQHVSSDHMAKSVLEDWSILTSFISFEYALAWFGLPPQGYEGLSLFVETKFRLLTFSIFSAQHTQNTPTVNIKSNEESRESQMNKHILAFTHVTVCVLTLRAPIMTAADDIHKYFFTVLERKK